MSPDSPEPETEYQLTPRTEAKYSKIDEDFQMMLQRNQINGQRVILPPLLLPEIMLHSL